MQVSSDQNQMSDTEDVKKIMTSYFSSRGVWIWTDLDHLVSPGNLIPGNQRPGRDGIGWNDWRAPTLVPENGWLLAIIHPIFAGFFHLRIQQQWSCAREQVDWKCLRTWRRPKDMVGHSWFVWGMSKIQTQAQVGNQDSGASPCLSVKYVVCIYIYIRMCVSTFFQIQSSSIDGKYSSLKHAQLQC